MVRFEVTFLDEYTDEALLDEIRRVAELNEGPCLRTSQFETLSGKVSIDTVRRRFGSWQAALKRARLEHLYCGQPLSDKMKRQHGKQLSDADLLAEVLRVHAIVGGHSLTTAQFDAHSTISSGTVSRRLGGWVRALQLAGGILPSENANKGWSAEECFENLAAVWIHHGKQPTFRQLFESPSRISGDAYITRWKHWRNAVVSFVRWASSESEKGNEPSSTPEVASISRVTAFPSKPREEDQRQVPLRLRYRIFRRDHFKCVLCGRSPATDHSVTLHADHIIAVCVGGKTTLENLRTLCSDCNLGKGKLSEHI